MIGYRIDRTLNKSPLFRGQFVRLQILTQILFIPQSSLVLLPKARKYNVFFKPRNQGKDSILN
jgi:hypothetical protein